MPEIIVEIVDRGHSPIPITVTGVQTRRVPGVGQEYVIRGLLTDHQLASNGTYERVLGIPNDFRPIRTTQRYGQPAMQYDLPDMTDYEAKEIAELFESLRDSKVVREEDNTRGSLVIMED